MTPPISEALKLRPYPTTLVLVPSGSSEICHRRAGPSFLPRDTHLHNTLLTAALGRPINRKSQAKESRSFLCPHLGEISCGSSLRDSAAAHQATRDHESSHQLQGSSFQVIPTLREK